MLQRESESEEREGCVENWDEEAFLEIDTTYVHIIVFVLQCESPLLGCPPLITTPR